MTDLVRRGKLYKTFIKNKFHLALTLKPYNIECQNSLWINIKSQQTLCRNQFLFKSVGVIIFCVDLIWNDLHKNCIASFFGGL